MRTQHFHAQPEGTKCEGGGMSHHHQSPESIGAEFTVTSKHPDLLRFVL